MCAIGSAVWLVRCFSRRRSRWIRRQSWMDRDQIDRGSPLRRAPASSTLEQWRWPALTNRQVFSGRPPAWKPTAARPSIEDVACTNECTKVDAHGTATQPPSVATRDHRSAGEPGRDRPSPGSLRVTSGRPAYRRQARHHRPDGTLDLGTLRAEKERSSSPAGLEPGRHCGRRPTPTCPPSSCADFAGHEARHKTPFPDLGLGPARGLTGAARRTLPTP